MFNLVKQLEGKHYKNYLDEEMVIDKVEIDENKDIVFWVNQKGDNGCINFSFDQLWEDFKEWA